MYLILIDAHSKWMEEHITSGATSAVTINKMKLTFSSLGLSEVLFTDNRPVFTSQEFANFIKANGIRHLTSVPYHPASNSLAERAVQTFKVAMKRLSIGSLEDKVMKLLFEYHITSQLTTGQSPSDLLFGRCLHSHLDLLKLGLSSKVRQKQNSQKHVHDHHAQECSFSVDDKVLAKNYGHGSPWLPGVILSKRNDTSLLVKLTDDSVICPYPDQLRHRSQEFTYATESFTDGAALDDMLAWPEISSPPEPAPVSTNDNQELTLRRSNRIRHPPNRFLSDI